MCFSFVAFVFPWERWFIGLLVFLFAIFFMKSQILLGFVLEFIFKMKILQEDLLASLMMYRVFALCCLYLFGFLDKDFVLNFLRVAWHSLMMFLQSSVNHGLLCFWDIVVLGMVLFDMLMRVLVKCIMGSSWFVFDSGISVVRHSFL